MYGGAPMFEVEKEENARNISSIVPYPQVKFNQFLYSNDIALVELEKPLEFSNDIGAVCLPEKEIKPNTMGGNQPICVTAGWGMDQPGRKYFA